jgi:hypothetical protein
MRMSLTPLFLLIFVLPLWPTKAPKLIKPKPNELPESALQLIQGVGPVLAKQLHQSGDWQNQPGIGPKTRLKLLKYLSP